MEGQYSQVWVILCVFYGLIASMRYWLRPVLIPIYSVVAPFVINNDSVIAFDNVKRFFTQDIIPTPFFRGESLDAFLGWLSVLLNDQALPGIINTLL